MFRCLSQGRDKKITRVLLRRHIVETTVEFFAEETCGIVLEGAELYFHILPQSSGIF